MLASLLTVTFAAATDAIASTREAVKAKQGGKQLLVKQ